MCMPSAKAPEPAKTPAPPVVKADQPEAAFVEEGTRSGEAKNKASKGRSALRLDLQIGGLSSKSGVNVGGV